VKDETPSFDFDAPDADVTVSGRADAVEGANPLGAPSSWREVPAARYLSWPLAMQMAYCRDRDLDSAEHAENEEWQQFYLQRANGYNDDINL
jgi:hypothetical protein